MAVARVPCAQGHKHEHPTLESMRNLLCTTTYKCLSYECEICKTTQGYRTATVDLRSGA